MAWQYNLVLIPLILSVVASSTLALLAWYRRSAPGALPFAIMMTGVAWWSLGYAMELGSLELAAKIFWSNWNFAAITIIPVAWLAFALQYIGRGAWLTRRNVVLLVIEPALVVLLAWTNGVHGLFRSSVVLDTGSPIAVLGVTYGPAFWIHATYSYVLLLLGTILLLQAFRRAPRLYRGQVGVMLVGALFPWIANALHIFGLGPVQYLDLTPFAFMLTGIAIAWGLFRFQLLDVVPAARDTVVEGMGDGVIVLDAQQRIVDLNPAAEAILGLTISDAVGQSWTCAVPNWLGDLNGALAQVPSPPSPCGVERQAQISDGEGPIPRTFEVQISALAQQGGRIAGCLILLRDITEHKRVEETLSLARDQALEASRLKTEFLANVSHDLRTPLNAIQGFADMLHDGVYGSLTEAQYRKVGRIAANARQLTSMVDDLLDQAKIEAGKLEIEEVPFSPAGLMEEVETIMAPQARAKGLQFQTEISDDLPASLSGDPQRIRQVLVNLVNNACKFTQEGHIRLRAYRPDADHWALQVSDTGEGIPKEAHHYIFDPFRRVDGSPTRVHSGVGLGLALVSRLVALMGGHIELDSELGSGSTFTVILPLDPVQAGL